MLLLLFLLFACADIIQIPLPLATENGTWTARALVQNPDNRSKARAVPISTAIRDRSYMGLLSGRIDDTNSTDTSLDLFNPNSSSS
jgi:hypothetical protein